MKTYEVSYMNGERTAVVQADHFLMADDKRGTVMFRQYEPEAQSTETIHLFFGVVSIVLQKLQQEILSEQLQEAVSTAEQVDEVFQQEVVKDVGYSPEVIGEIFNARQRLLGESETQVVEDAVDPISEEQKKTPGVAEWRRVVNLEAKNRRISFDQAAKLVNASSPALYGAMLMETGATMEEALRMMQDARLAFAVRDTAKHVRKQY